MLKCAIKKEAKLWI